MKITHASTFSGIGAPEIAAEMLGWENLFHCEINPFGRAVLDYYFPSSKSYDDITKTDFSEWRGKVTVLTGGFPCQPFSYAGKRRGSEDDRYLWPYMLNCIKQVQPDWFIGENVAGITTMALPGEDAEVGSMSDLFGENDEIHETHERYVLGEICESLESVGYSVQPFIIPACSVGAPHQRDRIFIIAHTNSEQSDRLLRAAGKQRTFRGEQEYRKDVLSERHRMDLYSDIGWFSEQEYVTIPKWNAADGERRWKTFPTQSPVYRGNDGLPFDVDDLTIPFGEWKKESLKAYGNAWCVQVGYEIMRAIDQIENSK